MATRLCFFCFAPYITVQQCAECIAPGIDAIYFIGPDIMRDDIAPRGQCVEFCNVVDRNNTILKDAFIKFSPTDVVFICEPYKHDKAVEAVFIWSRTAGFTPRIFIYQDKILYDGYFEVIRNLHGHVTKVGQ